MSLYEQTRGPGMVMREIRRPRIEVRVGCALDVVLVGPCSVVHTGHSDIDSRTALAHGSQGQGSGSVAVRAASAHTAQATAGVRQRIVPYGTRQYDVCIVIRMLYSSIVCACMSGRASCAWTRDFVPPKKHLPSHYLQVTAQPNHDRATLDAPQAALGATVCGRAPMRRTARARR